MKEKEIKINNYKINTINTDKFNKTTITVCFTIPCKKEYITINQILLDTLTYSTNKYNTTRLLNIELEDLYLANLTYYMERIGNLLITEINITFINQLKEDLFTKALGLLKEVLFNPLVMNNKFDKTTLKEIKEKYRNRMSSIKNNIPLYSKIQTFNQLESNDLVSYNILGDVDDLKNITPKSLYDYYINIFIKSNINILVVGKFNEEILKRDFKDLFNINNKSINYDNYELTYMNDNKLIIKDESIDYLEQSQLSLIYKCINISEFEREYVLPIYSRILGDGTFSKLFENVREKNSLAYTIRSSENTIDSILYIHCGINKDNYNKALELIEIEMSNMSKSITDLEMNSAKKDILSYLKSINDSTQLLIGYLQEINIFNKSDINIKTKNINKVTKEDIMKLSNKIKKSIVYLVKGDKDENN